MGSLALALVGAARTVGRAAASLWFRRISISRMEGTRAAPLPTDGPPASGEWVWACKHFLHLVYNRLFASRTVES